jgi:hypothetical protein
MALLVEVDIFMKSHPTGQILPIPLLRQHLIISLELMQKPIIFLQLSLILPIIMALINS